MEKSIFRQEALEKFSLPDDLDRRMVITSPRNWIAILASFILIASIVIWSFTFNIPIKIGGYGMLLPVNGMTQLSFKQEGVVTDIVTRSGQYVETGDILAIIDGEKILSKQNGRVVEIYRSVFENYKSGEPLLLMSNETLEKNELEVRLYVSASKGKKIKKDMLVNLSPVTVDVEEYGYLQGKVINVSEYPVSENEIFETLENNSVVESILENGPVMEIEVSLIINLNTHSGYSWSTPMGPNETLDSGILCKGMVFVDQVKPISYIIPTLSK